MKEEVLQLLKLVLNHWYLAFKFFHNISVKRKIQSTNLLKVNNRNSRRKCKIYSKLTTKTPERHYERHCQFWKYFPSFSSGSIADFEHVFVWWKARFLTKIKYWCISFLKNFEDYQRFAALKLFSKTMSPGRLTRLSALYTCVYILTPNHYPCRPASLGMVNR